MQKITPYLWFEREAKEAAEFYSAVFNDSFGSSDDTSRIKDTTTLYDTPSGTVDIVAIEISGQEFTLMSAGLLFKFNPSISFLIACNIKEEVETLWGKLSKNGTALMELGEYPFSEKYGWAQDKYGLSWQVMFMGEHEIKQRITPTLMFVGDVCGKAEEAVNFYASVFRTVEVGAILLYTEGEEPDREGTVKHAAFTLEGQDFAAMDSARSHGFAFNEAISFMVHCENQEEVDYYWRKLTAAPEAEQCGWLKDPYGVSWQVVPDELEKLLRDNDSEKTERVMKAMLQMKKIDISGLRRAYEGIE